MLAPFFFTALATRAKWLHKWQHKITGKKKTLRIKDLYVLLAEAQGFEPWIPCGMPVFKTGAIDHSAKLPESILEKNREGE